jgi:hypothetical protein
MMAAAMRTSSFAQPIIVLQPFRIVPSHGPDAQLAYCLVISTGVTMLNRYGAVLGQVGNFSTRAA